MAIAFSHIHSGQRPTAGMSSMSSPTPPSVATCVSTVRMRELSTQRAEMQHRRDADGLHDLAQAGAGGVEDLGAQVAGLGAGGGGAAGDHHQHVAGDEALDQLDDALVLGHARVVAADDAGEAADAAGDDGVVERPEGAAVEAALHVVEVLVREAGDQRSRWYVGDVDRAAVGVVVDRHAHDLAGGLGGAVLVELDVRRRPVSWPSATS